MVIPVHTLWWCCAFFGCPIYVWSLAIMEWTHLHARCYDTLVDSSSQQHNYQFYTKPLKGRETNFMVKLNEPSCSSTCVKVVHWNLNSYRWIQSPEGKPLRTPWNQPAKKEFLSSAKLLPYIDIQETTHTVGQRLYSCKQKTDSHAETRNCNHRPLVLGFPN